jgi:hypothetical protein
VTFRKLEERVRGDHVAQEKRRDLCGHSWRYAPVSTLPSWQPRRTCRRCGKVEWLTASEESE